MVKESVRESDSQHQVSCDLRQPTLEETVYHSFPVTIVSLQEQIYFMQIKNFKIIFPCILLRWIGKSCLLHYLDFCILLPSFYLFPNCISVFSLSLLYFLTIYLELSSLHTNVPASPSKANKEAHLILKEKE